MIPIYRSHLIQIEVTNACNHQCANCTRFVGHHRRSYFMSLSAIEQAIDSLDGYRGSIGIMGGEPTLHPEFLEICKLLQKKVPAHKCGLWTSGYKWEEFKDVILSTFRLGVYYNDHSDPTQRHQPILVGIDEVIDDKKLMWQLIDNCWIQKNWSASINPKGAFFCEVAAALDMVFEGPGGYPIKKGWWDKTPQQFRDQVERYCPRCSGALPMLRPHNQSVNDLASPKNLQRLIELKSPRALRGKVEVFDRKMDEDVHLYKRHWRPWRYLGSELKRKQDLKWDELWLLRGFHGLRKYFYRFMFLLKGGSK